MSVFQIDIEQENDILLEYTTSICPECKITLPAQLLQRDHRVILRKHCPSHGSFEALVYSDAVMFKSIAPFNKPGTPARKFATSVARGCPWDCGLCPEHTQHMCLGIIEINSKCNLDCPLCLADSVSPKHQSTGFELNKQQVSYMLDKFIESEAQPEVVQFSGGEPSLHPQILEFIDMALSRGISYVMLNTNGIRIARDDRFLEGLARLKPHIYLQFDGFDSHTNQVLRGRSDLLDIKLKALDRMAEADLRVVLVPVIEYQVNEYEIGRIIEFAIRHPAVFGISFQSAFHAQRYPAANPLNRITAPDIINAIQLQTNGLLRSDDFIPIPCCAPTCGVATYTFLTEERVIPIPRLIPVNRYLNYITNRTLPDLDQNLLHLLENLWSSGAKVGAEQATRFMLEALVRTRVPVQMREPDWTGERCVSCRFGLSLEHHTTRDLGRHIFMISIRDFMDPFNFDLKDIHKCCIGVLQPDGSAVPFCAYNSLGYRERTRERLKVNPEWIGG